MQQQGLANGNDKQQNLRTTVTADLIKCTKPSSQPASKSHPDIPAQHRQKSHHAALPPRPPSKRQACRGTFKRILQQRLQEDQAFAEFEAAVKSGPGTASAPTPPPPPAPPVTEGGVVKKKRGRPPKPRPLYPVPTRPLFYGPHLATVLREVHSIRNRSMPVGTPVWVKVMGYCAWPALVWSLHLCAKATWPDIIINYTPGKLLVRYYGEHSSSWVAAKQLVLWDDTSEGDKMEALRAWGKRTNKTKLVCATLDELAGRSDNKDEETNRMARMGRTYQLDHWQLAARARHSELLHPTGHTSSSDHAHSTTAAVSAAEDHMQLGDHQVPNSSNAGSAAAAAGAAGPSPAAAAGGVGVGVVRGDPWGVCDVCREEVPNMRCAGCRRWLHALCCSPPALSPTEYPHDKDWNCPACGAANKVKVLPEEEFLHQAAAAGVGGVAERMGLTPDWIITTAAFKIFQLPRPTPEQPFIAGLLDPACNNKLEPNIPAEVLYDKKDDGLKPSNSWAGYHIILNPDFRAQVQWKFVNRAIDEVENGNVPAVILICRNSTDTAYFQRLRPYPRVLLRRSSAQFKDYDKSPIGFGVVVFCVAKAECHDLYQRFYDGFAKFGEPNIPIDKEFMWSDSFYHLLDRLRQHAEQHARDHWVQCSACGVWRIITYQQLHMLQEDGADDWTCSKLRPPHTSCATPRSKAELAGMNNAAVIAAAAATSGVHKEAPGQPAIQGATLAAALDEHQEQQPKNNKLLPALKQALLQQAALAAAAGDDRNEQQPSAMHSSIGAAEEAVVGELPASEQADAVVTAVTVQREASELLLLLGAAADRVQHDLVVAYLCKSTAGQLSTSQAAALLTQQQQQQQQSGTVKLELSPAAAAEQVQHTSQQKGSSAAAPDNVMPGGGIAETRDGSVEATTTAAAAVTVADRSDRQKGDVIMTSLRTVQKDHEHQQQQQQQQAEHEDEQQGRSHYKRKLRSSSQDQSHVKRSRRGQTSRKDTSGYKQQQQQQSKKRSTGDPEQQQHTETASDGHQVPAPVVVNKQSTAMKRRHQQVTQGDPQQPKTPSPPPQQQQQQQAAAQQASEGSIHDRNNQLQGSIAAAPAAAAAEGCPRLPASAVSDDVRGVSPGLDHLAVVVPAVISDWLVLLVREQLMAWNERQALIQQALEKEREAHQQQQQQQQHGAQAVGAADGKIDGTVDGADAKQQQAVQEMLPVSSAPAAAAAVEASVLDQQQDHVAEETVVAAALLNVNEQQQQQVVGQNIEADQQPEADTVTTSCSDAAAAATAHVSPGQLMPSTADAGAAGAGADQILSVVVSELCLPQPDDDQQQTAQRSVEDSGEGAADTGSGTPAAGAAGACTCTPMILGSEQQVSIRHQQHQQQQQQAKKCTENSHEDLSVSPSSRSEATAADVDVPVVADAAAWPGDPLLHTSGITVLPAAVEQDTSKAIKVVTRAQQDTTTTAAAAAAAAPADPESTKLSAVSAQKLAAEFTSNDQAAVTKQPVAAAAAAGGAVVELDHKQQTAGIQVADADATAAAAVDGTNSSSDTAQVTGACSHVTAATTGSAITTAGVAVQVPHLQYSSLQQQQFPFNWAAAALQQQPQQLLVMRSVVPAVSAADRGGVSVPVVNQLQLVPLLLTGSAQLPQQHVMQQQQIQFQLQWQLAQNALLQQMRRQQMCGVPAVTSTAATTCITAAAAAANTAGARPGVIPPGSGGRRVAAGDNTPQVQVAQQGSGKRRSRSNGTVASRGFDAERVKRQAAAAAQAGQWPVKDLCNRSAGVGVDGDVLDRGAAMSHGLTLVAPDPAFMAAQPVDEESIQGQHSGGMAAAQLETLNGDQNSQVLGTEAQQQLAAAAAAADSLPQPAQVMNTAAGPENGEQPAAAVGDHELEADVAPDSSDMLAGAAEVDSGQGSGNEVCTDKAAAAAAAAASCEAANHPAFHMQQPTLQTEAAPDTAAAADSDESSMLVPPAAAPAPPLPPSLLLQVAPVRLSEGTILSLTKDLLVRAVLLEQPAQLRAVVKLMQQVCLYKQKQMKLVQQGQQQKPLLPEAACDDQDQRHVLASDGQQDGDPDPPGINHNDGDQLDQDQPLDADLDCPMFDLHCPGSDLICWDTLDSLTRQPGHRSWGKRQQPIYHTQQQQHKAADGGDEVHDADHDVPVGAAGDQADQDHDSDEDEETAEFMSSLALAREARVAANRAYLRGLGLAPSSIQSGLVSPLQHDHMAVVAAARKVAQQAAVRRAEQQLSHRQRALDARRRARRSHEAQLRSALDALTADEAHAQQLVRVAQRTLEEVRLLAEQ